MLRGGIPNAIQRWLLDLVVSYALRDCWVRPGESGRPLDLDWSLNLSPAGVVLEGPGGLTYDGLTDCIPPVQGYVLVRALIWEDYPDPTGHE